MFDYLCCVVWFVFWVLCVCGRYRCVCVFLFIILRFDVFVLLCCVVRVRLLVFGCLFCMLRV